MRQSLLGNTPVVETRLRVPSGDAVHRVYTARGLDGREALVVEVHNDTKVPFAVALAVRPYDLTGVGGVARIQLDGPLVRVDGAPAVVLPRSPGRVALSDAERDAATIVFAGDAEAVRPAEIRCADRLANAAFLFPLAHTATLRVAVPLSGRDDEVVEPSSLPSAEQVAAGWEALTRSGARVEVPNRRLRDAIAACTRYLFLAGPGPEAAAALDLFGFEDEAARRLLPAPRSRRAACSTPSGRTGR